MSPLLPILHLAIALFAILLTAMAVIETTRSARLAAHRRFGLALSALGVATAVHFTVAAFTRPDQVGAAEGAHVAALTLTLLPLAVFFWLRVEAYLDGPGDRFLEGRPGWISLFPSAVACGEGGVLVTAWMNPPRWESGSGDVALRWLGVLPTLLVIATLLAIGWSLLRGQQIRRAVLGGWSLSGLAVTLTFPTGAVVYATHALTVRPTLVGSLVDALGVPAALWFCRECRRLTGTAERAGYRQTVTIRAQRSMRPAPWAATDSG